MMCAMCGKETLVRYKDPLERGTGATREKIAGVTS